MNTIHLPIWEARRSGGGMTITGQDADGSPYLTGWAMREARRP